MQWISFGGIKPNILIVLTVVYGLMRGDKTGLLVGLFCGLFIDIFFESFIGFNAIVYMYIGYFNGKLNQVFYKEDIKLPVVMIVLSDLVYGITYYVFMFLLRGRFDFSYYFGTIILPEMIYTIVASFVMYPVLLLIHNALERDKINRGMKFV